MSGAPRKGGFRLCGFFFFRTHNQPGHQGDASNQRDTDSQQIYFVWNNETQSNGNEDDAHPPGQFAPVEAGNSQPQEEGACQQLGCTDDNFNDRSLQQDRRVIDKYKGTQETNQGKQHAP